MHRALEQLVPTAQDDARREMMRARSRGVRVCSLEEAEEEERQLDRVLLLVRQVGSTCTCTRESNQRARTPVWAR